MLVNVVPESLLTQILVYFIDNMNLTWSPNCVHIGHPIHTLHDIKKVSVNYETAKMIVAVIFYARKMSQTENRTRNSEGQR